MPSLSWASKTPPSPLGAHLELESIIFPGEKGYPDQEAQDRMLWGDNLAAMWALLPEYENRIDLIYADPPFFTNRAFPARVGRGEDSRKPQEWLLAEGYPDHWSSLDAYLDMLYPRLVLMHRLLSPGGTLYLHLDWHANAYARLLLDEIFGQERLLNEIVWVYHGPSPIRSAFNRKHDTLLVYAKSDRYVFNVDAVRQPYDPSTVKTFASSLKAGFGKVPDLERGKVPEDWWYFPVVARLHNERTGYPTQKPESLLERILLASSNPGDLVADFFCGSGTTAAVASRLGRRYLCGDVSWRAVHTSRARLVQVGAPPFAIQAVRTDDSPARESGADGPMMWQDFSASLAGQEICLSSQSAAGLDYWEVDPNWDGICFRSAAQAIRPLRKGRLPLCLALSSTVDPSQVRLRAVDVNGLSKFGRIR